MRSRRLVAYLTAAVVLLFGLGAMLPRPATGAPQSTADYVVIAGVPGLRWEDVNARDTPTLWAMADRGAIGSLSVRTARRPTCPTDGWLTLGAGNYAAWDGRTVERPCPGLAVDVQRPDRIGANLPAQRSVVRHNQEDRPWGTLPGALAESVRCTVAVGPGAAVAAAQPFGRVDQYTPTLPADPRELLASCVLGIVDLGAVTSEKPADRAAEVRRADALLARVVAARPARSLIVVAGLSDTGRSTRLHVVVADGPGWNRGWLTSASTGRAGYLQLVDLAPTALSAMGRAMPVRLFTGKPASVTGSRPADLSRAVTAAADADREARVQRGVANRFFTLLAAGQLLLFAALVPLMRRARRHAGPTGPTGPSRRLVGVTELALIAAALAVPAVLITDAVPWWRSQSASWVFAAITVALVAVGTMLVRLSRTYRSTLGPLSVVLGGSAAIVVIDVLSGARSQLNGVAGYSALEGIRFAGLGPVALGVFIAGTLVFAGCLAQRVGRGWRPVVVVVVGALAVVLVGSPYLGADPVAAIALTAGVCVAAAIALGGWLTFARVAWATLAGLTVTIGFSVLDLRRPVVEQGSLGRLFTAFADGTGGPAVQRAAASNVHGLIDSPLTALAGIGALLLAFVLFSPWGGLKRLFGLHPAVRAAMAGTALAVLLAGVLGGSALQVAGAAAAVMVPMAALTVLRVLDHAADRTRPLAVPITDRMPPRDPPTPSPAEPAAAPSQAEPAAVPSPAEPAAAPSQAEPAVAPSPAEPAAAAQPTRPP
ncbi:MAG TPA: hypothetical protein VF755_07065, partial [Catenuloplanes sp.]